MMMHQIVESSVVSESGSDEKRTLLNNRKLNVVSRDVSCSLEGSVLVSVRYNPEIHQRSNTGELCTQ